MDNKERVAKLDEAFEVITEAQDDLRRGLNSLRRAVKLIDKAGGAGVAVGQLESYTIGHLKSFIDDYNTSSAGNLNAVLDIILDKIDELQAVKNEG